MPGRHRHLKQRARGQPAGIGGEGREMGGEGRGGMRKGGDRGGWRGEEWRGTSVNTWLWGVGAYSVDRAQRSLHKPLTGCTHLTEGMKAWGAELPHPQFTPMIHTCRYEIVGELTEYTRDINPSMAREAVRAVGCIALAVGGGGGWAGGVQCSSSSPRTFPSLDPRTTWRGRAAFHTFPHSRCRM